LNSSSRLSRENPQKEKIVKMTVFVSKYLSMELSCFASEPSLQRKFTSKAFNARKYDFYRTSPRTAC
jgi:hypothetical protein